MLNVDQEQRLGPFVTGRFIPECITVMGNQGITGNAVDGSRKMLPSGAVYITKRSGTRTEHIGTAHFNSAYQTELLSLTD